MYMERHITEILKNRAKISRCLLLTGPKQVDKTKLSKRIYNDCNYLTFDDQLLLMDAINDPKLFIRNLNKPVILDEIQYAKELFAYIKIDCDKNDNYGNFYLTGSQQIKLIKKLKNLYKEE